MPQKEKVSFDEKRRIVLACISGKMGIREAGRIAGVRFSSVQKWIISRAEMLKPERSLQKSNMQKNSAASVTRIATIWTELKP